MPITPYTPSSAFWGGFLGGAENNRADERTNLYAKQLAQQGEYLDIAKDRNQREMSQEDRNKKLFEIEQILKQEQLKDFKTQSLKKALNAWYNGDPLANLQALRQMEPDLLNISKNPDGSVVLDSQTVGRKTLTPDQWQQMLANEPMEKITLKDGRTVNIPRSKYIEASLKMLTEKKAQTGQFIETPQGIFYGDKETGDISLKQPLNPAAGGEKNQTEEQLTRAALRGDKEAQQILDKMQERKLAIQQAGLENQKNVYSKEATSMANGIMGGIIPPKVQGFGMSRVAPQVYAMLADNGFDLATAQQDYDATKKYLGTLNGAQQVRLRQAVSFTWDSLDVVERLAKQWDAGRYPILNSVNIKAALNGVYGADAQKIATALKTQIADLVSELGTVYKGGNSSTDESLKLAAENLKAEWSYDQLVNNVELIRENLRYRQNSMKFSGAAGVAAKSPYTNKRMQEAGKTEQPVASEQAQPEPSGDNGQQRFEILSVE